MSKNYKKKINKEEVDTVEEETPLSKKELYDLNKQKKEEERLKQMKKTDKKKKKIVHQPTNKLARIFAVFMLILMIGSVFVSFVTYLSR